MASVYLARQESLDRPVALKLLRRFDSPIESERFLNEGRFIASLSHRNIITIHDLGQAGERHYISMEYLEGGSLQERIGRELSVNDALDLLEQLGECLDFAHRKGIVHRDIKPANILFHRDGTPILSDFGIAKLRQANSELTMDGMALGSPYYLSPEQARCMPLDGRADIYGLGVIFFELLTGRRPYQGGSPVEVIMAQVSEPVPRLPGNLQGYQDFLERLMAKDRDQRFPTARAMVKHLRALRGVLDAAPVSPAGDSSARITTRSPDRTRKIALAAAAGGVALVLATAAMIVGPSRDDGGDLSSAVRSGGAVADPPQPPRVSESQSDPGSWLETLAQPGVTVSAITLEDEEQVFAPVQDQPGEPALLAGGPNPWPSTDTLLKQAQTALDDYRLTTPRGDNAYLYYGEVLGRAPNHPEARQGMEAIANAYASLAEQALSRFNHVAARRYLRLGLAVDPDNRRLSVLRIRMVAYNDSPPGFRGRR